MLIASILALLAASGVFLWQVEVSDTTAGVTRTCGSAFDSVTDRSGWEQWWARDLDETPPSTGTNLLRTRTCPTAVNRRIAASVSLAGIGAALLVLSGRRGPETQVDSGSGQADVAGKLARLGRRTSVAGAALTVAGSAAIVVLVADSESTLFLYTDRLVVGVVGLIVLMPTMALFVIGRALSIGGRTLGRARSEEDSP